MKLAAVILVTVGTVGVIVTFVFMRKKLDELLKLKEQQDRLRRKEARRMRELRRAKGEGK